MKVIPGNIRRSTHLRKPRALKNPDGNSYFSFDIIKKKANHTWGYFFFLSYKLYEENFTQKKVFTFQRNPDWKLENIIEIAERIKI